MSARIILLVTSPRLPAGLLTAAAWDVVRAHPVLTAAEGELAAVLRSAGAAVRIVPPDAATVLEAAGTGGTVVWLAGPSGDEVLARELGLRLAREPGRAELELMYGSWDPPGARLLDAVAVLDRLLSPGGDPWKREQTHTTLAHFLLEECYEAYDAIDSGDLAALCEELGDVLLQVVLHARLAEELPEGERWTIDDVAGGLVDKMIRRNPHVFAGVTVEDVDEIVDNWEQIKQTEKARGSAMDGIVLTQPALALAAKILQRAERSGIEVPLPPVPPGRPVGEVGRAVAVEPAERGAARSADEESLGAGLLATVAGARAVGLDAEGALRRAALAYADVVRAAERRARTD